MSENLIIDDTDLKTTFGLALENSYIWSMPEPTINLIEIPGKNGALDLTEALTGDVNFKSREIECVLIGKLDDLKWTRAKEFLFLRHGKRVKIGTGHFYLDGRMEITEVKRQKDATTIVIKAVCNPFRLFDMETVRSFSKGDTDTSITGKVKVYQMPVNPVVTTDKDCTLTIDGLTFSLTSGENRFLGLTLKGGETEFLATGCDYIEFKFLDGRI